MRYKFKEKSKKIISLILASILFSSALPQTNFTGVLEAFASPTQGIGVATGPTQPGPGAGGCHAVFLATIENNMTADELSSSDYTGKNMLTGADEQLAAVNAQIIKSYRNVWDSNNLIVPSNLSKAAFYFKEGFNSHSGGKTLCLHVDSSNSQPDCELISSVGAFDDFVGPFYNVDALPPGQDYATATLHTWFHTYQMMASEAVDDGGLVWPATDDAEASKWVEALMYSSLSPKTTYTDAPYGHGRPAYNAQYIMQAVAKNYYANEGAYIYMIPQMHDRFTMFGMGDTTVDNLPIIEGAEALMEAIYMAGNIRLAEYQQQEILEDQRALLKQYIMKWNNPSEKEFVVLVDVAFAGQNDGDVPHLYSWKAATTWNDQRSGTTNITPAIVDQMGVDIHSGMTGIEGDLATALEQIEIADHNFLTNSTNNGKVVGFYKWMAHYLNSYDIGHNRGTRSGKGLLKYTEGETATYLLTPYGWESTIRITDAKGRPLGMPGFGILAAKASNNPPPPGHGCEDPPPCSDNDTCDDPNDPECQQKFGGSISVTVDPRSKKVNVSEQQPCVENEQVTMKVQIKEGQILDGTQGPLASAVAAGGGAKVVVILTATNEDHGTSNEPGDPDFFNLEGQMPSDFITKEKLGNNKVRLTSKEVKSVAELKTLLRNIQNISYIDNTITVCDSVTNRYYARGYICIRGGSTHNDYHFNPTGTETEDLWAYDEARLYGSIDPFYYSDMRHLPVSEIKANDPRNETYEAMAGVPTTTDLYLGVGGTEYMVNVDLKYKKEKGTRVYTITVTNSKCYGSDGSCSGTCPGPLYDKDGQITHPKHSNLDCGFPSCGTHVANKSHPGTCTYSYTIEQPIDEYAFLDIEKAQMWLLDRFKYTGNKLLSDPFEHTFDPNIGFDGFFEVDSDGTKYNAANWSSGSGRLLFNKEISGSGKSQYWSDTTKEFSNTINGKHSECKKKAQENIDSIVASLTGTKCTVYSDYIIAETSEGYQNVMYHTQDSQEEDLSTYKYVMPNHADPSDKDFTNAVEAVKVKSAGIHFDEVKTQEDLWDNNGNSSSDWDSTHPTTTGYNGNYSSPSTKYNNSNSTSKSNLLCKTAETYQQPNAVFNHQSGGFEGNYNSRYIDTGYNILDSTTPPPERQWSASDSIKPVTNGEWDTGHMKVIYEKVIEHNGTKGGKNFTKWTNWQEAPYSEEHEKINNIVIHNPISNRDATIISNDAEYDKRIYESLDQIGTNTPPKAVCPDNETCQFSTLTCTQPTGVHVAGTCYTDTVVGKDCGMKPLNKHVHDENCLTVHNEVYSKWEWVGCRNHGGTVTVTGTSKPSYNGASGTCAVSGAHWELVSTTDTGDKYVITQGYEPILKGQSGASYPIDVPCVPTSSGGYKLYLTRNNTNTETYEIWRFTQDITYHLIKRRWNNGSLISFECLTCGAPGSCKPSYKYSETAHDYVELIDINAVGCTNKPNSHVHTSYCKDRVNRVLKCTNPHHHFPGEPWDYNSQKNHYPYADLRCYTPCRDDNNHNTPTKVEIPGMPPQEQTGNIFINIDREFKIYYPDVGDFEQQPNLLGIGDTTDIRGKGYINNCDTDTWLRNKFVKYPWHSVDEVNNLWLAGEYIDLLKLPGHVTSGINPDPAKIYKFECVLGNSEAANAMVTFHSIANNAPEQYMFDDANHHTNDKRYSSHKAKHSVRKTQIVDVVGYIGALSLHDVGDPRFAELFKKVETNPNRAGWLIPNVVRKVDYTKSNYIVADNIDVRYENARTTGYWHGVYGVTDVDTGGKNHEHKDLPLRPKDNPIPSLKTEAMRPGYLSYFDIETVGNYYGENTYIDPVTKTVKHLGRNSDGSQVSYNVMMQVKPKYYELNLDTKQYKRVDVYEYSNSTYKPVCLWKGLKKTNNSYDSDYYLYLDWLNEQDRRSYTGQEALNSVAVQQHEKIEYNADSGIVGDLFSGAWSYTPLLPGNQRDPIGIKNALYLIDFDRTFIGSTKRYGRDYNYGNALTGAAQGSRIEPEEFYKQSQRWHFTLGLPSSSVFVYENEIPTDARIKDMKSHNAVIVCTIEIKVRGTVWTLQYDGSLINRVDGNGFKITEDGPEYPPPPLPETVPEGEPDPTPGPGNNPQPEDPVVIIYENSKTAADDIQTVGTH